MTGAIPKYGKEFRLDRMPGYDPFYSHSVYVYKDDPSWYIRSDHTSHKWYIFVAGIRPAYVTYPTLTKAMRALTNAMQAFREGAKEW